ncbi:MAG TPA: cupin domain-containing protein [Bacteroidota bacterium]|nr:cupin domain-containing protein [Bacteroidota bacterium]
MKSLEQILSSYAWFDHMEGMKFVETHRDAFRTSGHWLFLPKAISSFHKVTNTAELWFIHEGKLLLHILTPDGNHRQVMLGTDLQAGEQPAVEIPADCWQAAELPESVAFAFGTNVCAPAFSYECFISADRNLLSKEFPLHHDLILRLTHDNEK